MLMENIQKCIFFLIFHLAHFFCSRVYTQCVIVALLTTLSVSQPLTNIAELTKLCKANTLTNTPLSTAYHTQCQSASNHHC